MIKTFIFLAANISVIIVISIVISLFSISGTLNAEGITVHPHGCDEKLKNKKQTKKINSPQQP